jgi:glycosyltransferase involved in cell wall biosynthesis
MSDRLACSVIIPTYNRMELLRRTFECLIRQDLGTDRFEVLVVDDGSSDDTAALVDRYRSRLNVRYFFQADEGFRVAAARNIGIANAAANVSVFIDCGVLPQSGFLSAHVKSHEAARPVAVIGYVYCFFDYDNDDAERMITSLDFDDPDGTIASLRIQGRWLDRREPFYARYHDAIGDLPAPWLMYWTCNVSADTEQLRAIGGFDEAFRTWGGEDTDLAYRLHAHGARFVLNREAGAIHYPHEKDHARNQQHGQQSMAYIIEKHRSPIVRLLIADPPIEWFDINEVARERGLSTPRATAG